MRMLLPTKEEYLKITKKDKKKLTDDSFAEFSSIFDKVETITNAFDKKVEEVLGLSDIDVYNAANEIIEIVNSDKYKEGIQHKQYRYYHFVKFVNAILYEKQCSDGYSISSFKSIDDINEIYQQLTMYLRRIEFDLDIRDQLEIFVYIRQKRLSYFHVLATIEFGTIYHKSKVYKKMAEYIGIRGEEYWHQFFIEWDRTHESK